MLAQQTVMASNRPTNEMQDKRKKGVGWGFFSNMRNKRVFCLAFSFLCARFRLLVHNGLTNIKSGRTEGRLKGESLLSN